MVVDDFDASLHWSTGPTVPDQQETLSCLATWLTIADETVAGAYLRQHAKMFCPPATVAVLQRWVAHAPPELATLWSTRLAVLKKYPVA